MKLALRNSNFRFLAYSREKKRLRRIYRKGPANHRQGVKIKEENSRNGNFSFPKVELKNGEYTVLASHVGKTIALPSDFSFTRNFRNTTKAFENVRQALGLSESPLDGNKKSPLAADFNFRSPPIIIKDYIDFCSMDRIGQDAALVLAAYFFEANTYSKPVGLYTVEERNWCSEVKRKLIGAGFYQIMGLGVPFATDPEINLVKMLPNKLKSYDHTNYAGEIEGICEGSLSLNLKEFIESNFGEFFINLRSHAYQDLRRNGFPDWWSVSSFDKLSKELRISFYDIGFGIPRTVHKKRTTAADELGWRAVKLLDPALAGREDLRHDPYTLEVVVSEPSSGTGHPWRGSGLGKLCVDLQRQAEFRKMEITSQGGRVVITKNKENDRDMTPYPLKGTLFSIMFKL